MTFNSGMPLLLHAADFHIGDSRNLPNYLERQDKMLQEMLRLSEEHQVDVTVVAGDIFDSKYMKPREKDMFLEWMIDNDRAGKRHDYWTVIIDGNHDQIEEGYTHLRGHKIMSDRSMLTNTIIVESEPRLLGPFKDRIYVAALPARSYKGDEINFMVDALYKKWESDLDSRNEKPEDYYFVVVVHAGIYGAENELGNYRVTRGPKLDQNLPVTYWALGDIHAPFQQILPNAWYSGSPIQHEFGDLATERGVLLVDLDQPTEPEPVLMQGVKPLITLSEVPDEWPTDAIVRYEGTAEEIVDTVFPPNVVGFKPVIDETVRAVVDTSGDDLLDELSDVLVDQNVPEALQEDVVEEIKSAIATL